MCVHAHAIAHACRVSKDSFWELALPSPAASGDGTQVVKTCRSSIFFFFFKSAEPSHWPHFCFKNCGAQLLSEPPGNMPRTPNTIVGPQLMADGTREVGGRHPCETPLHLPPNRSAKYIISALTEARKTVKYIEIGLY